MSLTNQIRPKSIRALLVTTGVFFTATFWLVVATYPAFFLFNPFENESPARAALLAALIAAWLILANGPLVIFSLFAAGKQWVLSLLPAVALAWPVLLLINHIVLVAFESNWYFGYLLDYPIFFMTDLLMPIFILVIWFELRPKEHPVRNAVGRHSTKLD
jgi:uncharacterized membrane-anchored protein YitT (DUF2179 family)